jgi:hypothetical protein
MVSEENSVWSFPLEKSHKFFQKKKMKIIVCLLLALGISQAVKLGPLIPGYNGPPMSQFAGYITVDETNGRNLFYWLIESQSNPDTAPLVVWFQGGPGCSGLIGLFEENGPYAVGLLLLRLKIESSEWKSELQPSFLDNHCKCVVH